jgi:hypothetical protein
MKIKVFLFIILLFTAFCFIGCASLISSLFIKHVMYSFAENDGENGSAVIDFVGGGSKVGVRLVDCEGIQIPAPAVGTYWESAVIFPAERELNIRVYVFWNEDRYGERRRGIFKCPPLEAGRKYKLKFKGNYKNGGSLFLTDALFDRIIIYEQVIPTLE